MNQQLYSRVSKFCLLLTLLLFQGNVFSQSGTLARTFRTDRDAPLQNPDQPAGQSLKESLKQLESRFGIHFTYNEKSLEGLSGQLIDESVSDIPAVLTKLLSPHGLAYKRYKKPDNTYFIYLKKEKVGAGSVESPLVGQSGKESSEALNNKVTDKQADENTDKVGAQSALITISGKVANDAGEGIPGANVLLKGTTTGTSSNEKGEYSLTVPDGNGTLVFSFIGYIPEEIAIGSQTTINVTLLPTIESLSEIVVVGYGEQKKATLTGSIATVEAKEVRNLPLANVSSGLAGRMAGVNISQSSGKPGASAAITIRAVGTLNNSAPLYVIDGVVRDQFAFDGLDPSEVENISVLKDAASAAVYGSRAANGVILVTTRRGKEGKTTFTYNATVGTEQAVKIPKMQNAYQQAVFINDGLQRANVAPNDGRYFTPDELEYYKTHSYDWVDIAFKNPLTMRHTLDVSGGTTKVKYYLAGSYFSATGTFSNLNFNKSTLRANVDAEVAKNLTASVSINLDTRHDRKPYWKYDEDSDQMRDLYNALLLRPGIVAPYINGQPTGNNVEWHPLEIIGGNTGYNKKKWNEYNTTLALEYTVPFIKGLKLKAQYNKFNRFTFVKQFSLPYQLTIFNSTGGNSHLVGDQVVGTKIRDDGEFLYERQNNLNAYQLDGYITYNKTFGKHSVDALFVYEQAETNTDQFEGQVNYFISSSVDQFSAGGSADPLNSTVSGQGFESGRVSFVSRLNYTYADKYIAEVSVRRDGSSTFPVSGRWGNFPSFSAAWRISQEPFFKRLAFVDEFKLRASVGLLGNDAVVTNQWRERYYKSDGAYFGSLSTGLAVGSLPNPNITWEKSLSYNGGVNATLFNNQVTFAFDAFYRKTYDILGPRNKTYPSTFGASLPDENYGQIDSKGFEIELGYRGQVGSNLTYFVQGTLGYAVNKYVIVDEASNIRDYQRVRGYNSDRIFAYEAVGILRTQSDLDALPAGYTILGKTPTLGMINYQDVRGATSDTPDGKIDENDQSFIGKHSRPPVNYGINAGISWKNFSLNALFQGMAGYEIMVDARFVGIRAVERTYAFWNDHWTPENTNAAYPAAVPRDWGYDEFPASNFWLRKGAFLRLKNVNLTYTIPTKLFGKLGVSGAKVFANATNLFLLQDHLKLRDPEATAFNSYPIMKNFSLGVNISF